MSTGTGKPIVTQLSQFLIEPSRYITIPAERRRARLLSGLLLFTVCMVSLSLMTTRVTTSLLTTVIVAIAFGISRTRHYEWGALLAIFALMIPSFAGVLNIAEDSLSVTTSVALPLSWLVLSLILASLWAKTWITVLVTTITIGMILALPLVRPGIDTRAITWISTLFLVSGGLLILAAAMRNRDLKEIELQTRTSESQRQQLELSTKRYRELVENVTDIVYTTDVKGYLTYVSPSAELLTGYPESQLIGMHYLQVVDPTWRDTLTDFYKKQYVSPESETTLTFPLMTARNQIRWVEQKVSPVFDRVHHLTGFQGVVRDITDRRQSEEKLRVLYEVMAQSTLTVDEQLNEALKVGSAILGLDLGIISRIDGDTYTVLYGFSPDGGLKSGQVFDFRQTYCELTYQNDDFLSIEHMSASDYNRHPCYGAFGLEAYVGVPLQVNGKRFGTLNFSSATPRSERVEGADRDFFLLMGKWVSTMLERKFALEALSASEANLRTILDNSPAVITRADRDCRIEFTRVPGVPLELLEPLVGQSYLDFMPEEFHAVARQAINNVFETRTSTQYESNTMDPRDGTQHWYLTNIAPIILDDEVVSALLVNNDITDRKQSEEQIQSQNESLVKTNRDLAIARKQAEAASKLKSQFLATMSHELRTPLNAVIGYAQLQMAGMVGELSDEQYEFQERILANAQHLLQLINEVLDLSKIEAGRMDLTEKPFGLRECLDEIVLQNRVLAEDKHLDFSLNVDDRLPEIIVGDRGRIKQVIINLVANAIKFTDQGSVVIDATLHNKESWRLAVTDTGAGISSTMQEHIFDEFRQAENGIDRGGTGLGLAIVRKLVLMMGGNIRLNSEVGRGSAFTITLPLVTEVQQITEAMEV